MNAALDYSNAEILEILDSVHSIAMVGASTNWKRPSYFAMKYLQAKGYRIIPINPRAAGEMVLGERIYASLSEIPDGFDMVDIFRPSEAVMPIIDEACAIARDKGIRVIWMQLGVINHAAVEKAEAAGLTVVMNRCPKIEFGRLHTELSWGGFNSKVITARRRKVIFP
jgi:predicted CoA-binding protein